VQVDSPIHWPPCIKPGYQHLHYQTNRRRGSQHRLLARCTWPHDAFHTGSRVIFHVCGGQVSSHSHCNFAAFAVGTGLSVPFPPTLTAATNPGKFLRETWEMIVFSKEMAQYCLSLVECANHMMLTAPTGPNSSHPAAVKMQRGLSRSLSLKGISTQVPEFWKSRKLQGPETAQQKGVHACQLCLFLWSNSRSNVSSSPVPSRQY